MSDYFIRPYKPEDKSFIMASWLRGLYYGDTWFSLIPKQIFMENYKHFLEALLDKSTIRIACSSEDPDQIFGYAVLSKSLQTVHWIFIKTLYRKKGIANQLVPKDITFVSHLTPLGQSLMVKRPGCVFNPFSVS